MRRKAICAAMILCFAIGTAQAQKLEFGVVNGVDANWKTVTLSQSYNSMVVICTPNYNRPSNPVVIRVANATGNSFQLLAQSPGNADPVTPIDVYYMVVEEGVYTEAQDGVKMEAVKVQSTVTAYKNNWVAESRAYQQSYDNPVVVGQVMTANDPNWSVFWSSDGTQTNPPSPTSLAVGKHVGEDTNQVRADETIGYIVIEAGSGVMDGVDYTAAVGPDVVEMIDEAPSPWTYSLSPLISVSGGVFTETAQDGNDGSWVVLVGSPPFSGGNAFLAQDEDHVGDRDTGHTNDQIAYIAFGSLPAASVSRSIGALIGKVGVAVPVRLDATTVKGGQIVVHEMVPTGLTPTNIVGPGTTSFAGGELTWTVDLAPTSGTVSLSYEVTPAAGPSALTWSATYDDTPSGTTGVAVGGDTSLTMENPVGIFDWHGDIGVDPVGQVNGNPSIPGNAALAGTIYTVTGAGGDVWGNVDRCHLAAKVMSGSYVIDAFVSWVDPGTNTWSKAGVMVRSSIDSASAQTFEGVRNPANSGTGADTIMQWRDADGAASAWTGAARQNPAPTWVRIAKVGNTLQGYYFDGTNWVLDAVHTNPGIDPTADTVACIFATSHQDDGGGVAPGAVTATATFDGVAITPLSVAGATRTIGQTTYAFGDNIPVSIEILHSADASVQVVETIPQGWTASNISNGGTQTGNQINWTLNLTADVTITYEVTPAGGMSSVGVFSGIVRDPFPMDIPIGGDSQIARQGSKPIILIVDTGSGRYGPPGSGTNDGNIQDLLGADGLTIGTTTVGGLGYPVQVVDHGAEDNVNYTQADGVCIVVSETVTSGNVFDHFADPLPLVMHEQALMDDRPTPRCSMHFSEGNAATATDAAFEFNIVNNTHEITKLWPLGNLRVFNTGQISLMQGAIAPDAIVLAQSPLAGEPCLAVFEAGVSGLMNPDPQDIPTVARRVGVGFHDNAMSSPTVDGAILYQRAVQWAIGGPVTAGTGAPSAPSGLIATQFINFAQLNWTDTSDNENGFVIARKDGDIASSNPFIDIGQVGNDVSTFIDQTVVIGNTYTYHVRAFNPDGESADSNDAEITIVARLGARNWYLYR